MARLRKQKLGLRSSPSRNATERSSARNHRRRARVVCRRSFASVTIKDIAGKLRINPALIYYYFESKQDLFRASIEAAIFDAVAHYDGIRSLHDDPVGLIDAWLESNVKLSHTIANLVKVMLDHSGLPRHIPSVDRLVKRFYEEEYRILSSAIGRRHRNRCVPTRRSAASGAVRIHPFRRRDGRRQDPSGLRLGCRRSRI